MKILVQPGTSGPSPMMEGTVQRRKMRLDEVRGVAGLATKKMVVKKIQAMKVADVT